MLNLYLVYIYFLLLPSNSFCAGAHGLCDGQADRNGNVNGVATGRGECLNS